MFAEPVGKSPLIANQKPGNVDLLVIHHINGVQSVLPNHLTLRRVKQLSLSCYKQIILMLNKGKNIILFIYEIFSYLVSSLNFPSHHGITIIEAASKHVFFIF